MLSPFHLLFPPSCPICGEDVGKDEVICKRCRKQLPLIIHHTWETEKLTSARAIFTYTYPIKPLLLKIKYHRDITLAYLLGREIGKLLKENKMSLHHLDYLIPIPTSRKRKKKRLYNQTEELIKGIRKEIPIPPILRIKRIRQEKSQVGLTREERRENIKGAFEIPVPGIEKIRGKKIMIFDDVYTTGATAEEMAEVLFSAGAREVHLLVCCKGKL